MIQEALFTLRENWKAFKTKNVKTATEREASKLKHYYGNANFSQKTVPSCKNNSNRNSRLKIGACRNNTLACSPGRDISAETVISDLQKCVFFFTLFHAKAYFSWIFIFYILLLKLDHSVVLDRLMFIGYICFIINKTQCHRKSLHCRVCKASKFQIVLLFKHIRKGSR
jgi:hypothetical protein